MSLHTKKVNHAIVLDSASDIISGEILSMNTNENRFQLDNHLIGLSFSSKACWCWAYARNMESRTLQLTTTPRASN